MPARVAVGISPARRIPCPPRDRRRAGARGRLPLPGGPDPDAPDGGTAEGSQARRRASATRRPLRALTWAAVPGSTPIWAAGPAGSVFLEPPADPAILPGSGSMPAGLRCGPPSFYRQTRPGIAEPQRVADRSCHLLGFTPDLRRREMQHHDAACTHPGVPLHSAPPVFGREVPFTRVHLTGDTRFLPPAVGNREKLSAQVEAGIEHGHRQPATPDQAAEVSLWGRPGAVRHFGKRPP